MFAAPPSGTVRPPACAPPLPAEAVPPVWPSPPLLGSPASPEARPALPFTEPVCLDEHDANAADADTKTNIQAPRFMRRHRASTSAETEGPPRTFRGRSTYRFFNKRSPLAVMSALAGKYTSTTWPSSWVASSAMSQAVLWFQVPAAPF